MRNVSAAYREAIQLHRTKGVRNQMYAEVILGVFAAGAKEDSTFTVSEGLPISDAQNMYHNTSPIVTSYATWEKDLFRLDAVQAFLPDEGIRAQGYISWDVAGDDGTFSEPIILTATFGQHYTAVGCSFIFDSVAEQFPISVAARSYDDETLLHEDTVENDSGADFKPEFMLQDFDRLELEFHAKPYQRVRINSIMYGIGYVYAGDDLISMKNTRKAHPLSLELPQAELEFTAYSENNRFDIDSNSSLVQFLQHSQEVSLRYGYDVTGQGNIEWMSGGIFYLDSWDAKGYRATFKCKDIFYRLTRGTYKIALPPYRGPAGRPTTLAQTAARILTDAGIEDYYVDDFDFRNTVTDVPIPYDSHATALQAVANFGTSTLEQEDNGKISFRQRYDPPISDWYVVYRPNGYPVPALPFTNIEGIVGESLVTEYAMWEENFFALDGSCCFVPETNDYKNGGMVFNVFPDSDRNYAHPGTRYYMGARIDFTQNRTFGRVVIELSPSNRYQQILVIANRSGIVGELWRKVYTVTGSNLVIDTLFDNIVWLTIYLYNGDIAQRYRIKKVLIERTTGLDLTGQDVLGKIGGTLQPRTKNIDVVGLGTSFWVGGTPPDFTKVTLEPGVLTEIKHTEPMYSVSAYCDDPNVVFDIEEHYAYTSFIQISGVTADTDVKLRGYTYAGTFEQLSRIAMNETGEDVVIENPIAWNNSYLERVCEWVADYYGKRNVYDIETLGYPECDAGDYIVLNGKEAVVLENTLSMNSGAMRGKMKLRGGK